MKSILWLILVLSLSGCAGSGGGGSGGGAAVVGADYSGTYKLNDIECYDTSWNLQVSGTYTTNTHFETITISGNSITVNDASGTSTGTTQGAVVFTDTGTSGSLAVGTFDITYASATTSDSGFDSYSYSITSVTGGSLSSSSYTTIVTNGTAPSNVTNASFIRNLSTGATGIVSGLSVTGQPTYTCLNVYTKQ